MPQEFAELIQPDTVRVERLLPGPIDRIWAYLTESDKRGQWLATGDMDLRPGGKAELFWMHKNLSKEPGDPPNKYAAIKDAGHRMASTILECDPPYLLAMTWACADGLSSEARFELEERGKDVLLTITHSKLPNRNEVLSVSGGWHTHLGILIDRLNGREPGNFWKSYEKLNGVYESRYGPGA